MANADLGVWIDEYLYRIERDEAGTAHGFLASRYSSMAIFGWTEIKISRRKYYSKTCLHHLPLTKQA